MGEIERVLKKQKEFFKTDKTKSVSFRIEALKTLKRALVENEERIIQALYLDLAKSQSESYMSELAMVYSEIKVSLKGVKNWSKARRVGQDLASFPASNYIYSEPYGSVLIMAPWNYPFYLTMAPLVAAIGAGNCVVLKSSRNSPNSSKLIKEIIEKNFSDEYIYCIDPDADYDESLMQKYDYIFFTGSPNVGKRVMKIASENLIPVTLELGGKSPCIIDESANLNLAAKRISWGKFLNAGQTCISVDYILVHEKVKEAFIKELIEEINKNYRLEDSTYPKIVNDKHFARLSKLLDSEEDKIGGKIDKATNKIGPTIFPNSDYSKEIMKEEIFGPILPVIEFKDFDLLVDKLRDLEKPLACYLFTEDKSHEDKLIKSVSFGGGCVNDVILHISNPNLPFGGVGFSGMGHYHGRYGFDTFSHKKGVVKSPTWIDLPFRYKPFDRKKLNFLKKLYK
ncbi:MAG: aldehyde dehydrogenase [Tissierellia bacterium]|nr:aldehyde dehydrogenase [Tissierellia bacterium]